MTMEVFTLFLPLQGLALLIGTNMREAQSLV